MSSLLDQIDSQVSQLLTRRRRRWLSQPRTLCGGFLTLYAIFFVALLPTIIRGEVLGDLPLYRIWAENGLQGGVWPGISMPWVYPIGALVPITLAGLAGPAFYQLLWFLLTMVLNAGALAVLTDFGRNRRAYSAAWWWLLISLVLSPVALLRLEGLTAPLVIAGLVLLARRPVVASALLTVATWIKVWPVAVLLAIIAAGRHRMRVIVTASVVTAAVATTVWALGGLATLTSFVTMQSDRALQLEAPISTPWVWLAAVGHPGSFIYENVTLATREVAGPGATAAAAAMTPLMLLAVVGIFTLILRAKRRSRDVTQLMLVGALALSTALVVFNKVGSPQYMLWIAPIVAVGIANDGQRWRVPAYLMLGIGLLTTLVFPVSYQPLIAGDPAAVLLLTLRNALVVLMLLWSSRSLWLLENVSVPAPHTREIGVVAVLDT
ncbi:glycosyltransferase 87 family protein [Glaciibacter psychrotolerans]|uniref:DUF2029 domain-containing protein n=1 Tax=Glaciibacter psychrotolerans TaxID=670054 RepID=A0A7Z0EGP5_9MICO|nr:glycosyltransferase 87 family protein [Leifsonia psychrotolerans]NYJ21181.1 hypothetical protein [Leifsonia psychrotolerans]